MRRGEATFPVRETREPRDSRGFMFAFCFTFSGFTLFSCLFSCFTFCFLQLLCWSFLSRCFFFCWGGGGGSFCCFLFCLFVLCFGHILFVEFFVHRMYVYSFFNHPKVVCFKCFVCCFCSPSKKEPS